MGIYLDESLVDVASVSAADAKLLKAENFDVLQLRAARAPCYPVEATTCIVQIVVRLDANATTGDEPFDEIGGAAPEISISPLMYEIMCTSAVALSQQSSDNQGLPGDDDGISECGVPVAVTMLPVPSSLRMVTEEFQQQNDNLCWTARKIDSIKDLPPGSSISLKLLYMQDKLIHHCEQSNYFEETLQSILSFFLQGRILMAGTTTTVHTQDEGVVIAIVTQIQEYIANQESGSVSKADSVYRLSFHGKYKLNIEHESALSDSEALESQNTRAGGIDWRPECAGYDRLVQSLTQLASMNGPAAPSGILLTGSPQVGKTHLASSVAFQLSRAGACVHWVSVQDLLLQATWASESDLMAVLRPPRQLSSDQLQLLVLDDLQIFATEESALQEDSVSLILDPELLVVKNAVLQIIDEMARSRAEGIAAASILGMTQSASNLPLEFTKSGRLEKELVMLPPTESQRETILRHLLSNLNEGRSGGEQLSQNWAEALTPVTVGCVAGDLRRILADACTRAMAREGCEDLDHSRPELNWIDLRKAAQTYMPLSLETVDVCKPKPYLSPGSNGDQNFSTVNEDWATIHRRSWESFGGYPLVKKRLMRTVVGPWRRFLKSVDRNQETLSPSGSMGLAPPPGVLFHGESGNGKSFAAVCLASSLGLPMIKVKAADVMDKWLGGSEAIIRSLFARARSAAPCVLFFDELDSIATNRASGDEGGGEVMSRLLSTLLNEMDGISSERRHGVLVLACTNRLEDLDAALLRPGRLEEHIHLQQPDSSDIREILRIHLLKVPMSEEIDLDALAKDLASKGASGAAVEGLCHEACLHAVHRCATTSDLILLPNDIMSSLRLTHQII